MTCTRCHGTMFEDYPLHSYTGGDTSDPRMHCRCWKCFYCGNYIDATILANRLIQQAETIAKQTQLQEAV